MTVTIVPEQNPAGEAHLEPFLTELVNESLNSYAYSNAVFLCERLHAASPTEVRVRSLAPIRPVHQRAPDRSDTTQSERSIGRVRDAWVRLPGGSRLVVPKTTRGRLPPTTTHRPPINLPTPGQQTPPGHVLLPTRPGQPSVPHTEGMHLPSMPLPPRALLRETPETSRGGSRAIALSPARGREAASHGFERRGKTGVRSLGGHTQRRSRTLSPRGHMQRDRPR